MWAPGVGVRDVPHLGFRLATEGRRHSGRRVHLDRQVVDAVEHLDEHRKSRRLPVGERGAEHGRAVTRPQLVQGHAGRGPARDHALFPRPVDQFPGLAVRLAVGQAPTEHGLQPTSSPHARLVDRREVQQAFESKHQGILVWNYNPPHAYTTSRPTLGPVVRLGDPRLRFRARGA